MKLDEAVKKGITVYTTINGKDLIVQPMGIRIEDRFYPTLVKVIFDIEIPKYKIFTTLSNYPMLSELLGIINPSNYWSQTTDFMNFNLKDIYIRETE